MAKKQTKKERKAVRSIETAAPLKVLAPKTSQPLALMTNWLVALVLICPILFSRKTIDPALTSRYLFLSGLVLLMITVFYLLRKKPVLFSTPILIKMMIGLALGFGLWSMFLIPSAINTGEGLYQVARYFLLLLLLFLVTATFRNEESNMLRLCKAFIIVSIIQGGVGILQYFEMGFTDLPGANAKPYGLMANRNLFGSAMMLMLPFVMFVLYKGNKGWKYISAFALAIIIISLVISQTRAAWLGSFVIIMVSLILVSVFSPPNRRKWIIATLSGMAGIAAIVFLLIASDGEGRFSKSVKERAASMTFSSDSVSEAGANADERFKIWKKTIAMFKDHPLTGVGPGNWRVAIAPYGGDELVWAYGKFIPDRPHNIYLHVLSETGIPGAILFFSLWLLVAIIGCKVLIKSKSGDRSVLIALMLAGLAGFACDSFFSFPTERFEHSIYMTIMAGIIIGCYANTVDTSPDKQNPVNKKLAVLFMLVAGINLFLAFRRQNFEIHMNRVKAYDKLDRYQEVLQEVKAGQSAFVTIDPDNKPLEMYSGLAYHGLKNYSKALEEMNIAKRYNPNSAMIYNNIGTIYTDTKVYDSAYNNYMRGLMITPRFDIIFKNLAVNYFASGNYSACIETIGKMNIEGDQYFNNMLNEARRLLTIKK